MAPAILSRLMHAWNAFTNDRFNDPTTYGGGYSYGQRPDRQRLQYSNERSIISSILTRLSIDIAGIDIRHVRLDEDDRYLEDIRSGMQDCLTVMANIDQGARQFRQDLVMTLFDKGVVAIVPVDTTSDPTVSGAFDIQTMRVGEIVAWFPKHIRVWVYNEVKGYREQLTLPKSAVAIMENPLYAVMNEPNSTLQRLIVKLNMLDAVDKASSSGKLDMIIQLPYVIKSEARRQQADQRRKDIEMQLTGSKYGIAYADGTEKITQLNRPADNNLLTQVEYLTNMLYSQLGLTDSIMNGTANEATMLNYINRTVKPVMDAISEAIISTFLTKTARAQKQSIMYFRNPFQLVPLSEMAKIADMFSRNEIMTPNEIRGAMGIRPSKDPKADKLQNSNMPITGKAPESNRPIPIQPVHRPLPIGASPPTSQPGTGGNSQNGSS